METLFVIISEDKNAREYHEKCEIKKNKTEWLFRNFRVHCFVAETRQKKKNRNSETFDLREKHFSICFWTTFSQNTCAHAHTRNTNTHSRTESRPKKKWARAHPPAYINRTNLTLLMIVLNAKIDR